MIVIATWSRQNLVVHKSQNEFLTMPAVSVILPWLTVRCPNGISLVQATEGTGTYVGSGPRRFGKFDQNGNENESRSGGQNVHRDTP
jgi:hypothetical protein